MTEQELKEIEERAHLCSPLCDRDYEGQPYRVINDWYGTTSEDTLDTSAADQDFINNSREDVISLLAEVRRLQALVASGENRKKDYTANR